MKKLSKIVSVVLSLVLCLGMASPAFAASFADLQGAINDTSNKNGTAIKNEDGTDTGRYGYAENTDEDGKHVSWGIEAWNATTKDDEGNETTTRNVQLNEDVKYSENKDPSKNTNIKIDYTVPKDVTDFAIDLNGNDIDGTGSSATEVILVKNNRTLELDDSTAKAETVTDEDGNETKTYTSGKITGGKNGISLRDATLNMENGTITGNSGAGVYANYNVTFTMENGSIDNNGGNGVTVFGSEKYGSTEFTMENGSIRDNKDKGVVVSGADGLGKFTMNDGEITGNVGKNANSMGGGVYANGGTFIMNGGKIAENSANKGGGGVSTNTASSRIELNGGEISGNSAPVGGGVSLYGGVLVNKGATITDNTATTGLGDDIILEKGCQEYTTSDRSYFFTYEKGEPVIGEDGKEQSTSLISITVKDENGNPIGQAVTTSALLKFEVDPADGRFPIPAGSTVDGQVSLCGGYLDKDGVFHVVHTPGAAVRDNVVDAGCLTAGSYESVTYCSICGTELSRTPGTIPATGHTPGEAARENVVEAQPGVDGSYDLVVRCTVCGDLISSEHVTIPALPVPPAPDNGGVDTAPDASTIEDQEVPLAGLTPLHMLLEELRQYEKVEDVELPEDFKWLDHEYAQAIYWGLQEELVADAEEEPLDPDEVITVALLREVLTNFVEYKGADLAVTLEGEDDEIVFDLGERLTAFYAELEASLEAQETKAA